MCCSMKARDLGAEGGMGLTGQQLINSYKASVPGQEW